jgi:hypothetical protein
MAICRCGLLASCCQPAVPGGIIYTDLWGELNTHLAPQALFIQSSPVQEPLLQAFPFPSTLGEVTLHPLSLACVFLYSSHRRWVFPLILWSFPPSTTLTNFPAPGCWARSCSPTRASPARLACLFSYRQDSPPLSLQCVFIVLIAYYSVSLFLRVEVSLSRGLCVLAQGFLCEYCVLLSSPCPHLLKLSGHGLLVNWGLSWFLYLM